MSFEDTSGVKVDHPFFRNCEKRTETPVEGKVVKGQLPIWLEGVLIRNGPGIQKVGKTSYNHLFDGLSILHKFVIKNGKATYQSRALESDAKKLNLAANRIVIGEFGTASFPDPCQSLLGSLQTKFLAVLGKQKEALEMTDNCSVNVGYYGDQLYAMTETVFLRRVDPESLKCIGDKTRIKDFCALNTATAHPHELEDGTVLNVGNNFKSKKGPCYLFVKVPPAFNTSETAYKNAKIIAEIPSRWRMNPAYFHSFGMTTDKIIFIETPYCLNLPSILTSPLLQKSFEECLYWHSGEKTRFHVVSMVDGKPHPITYESEGFFTFHHINAYEEDGFLIVDVAAYNDAEAVKHSKPQYLGAGKNYVEGASARRYVLPLSVEGAKPGENLVQLKTTTATAMLRNGTTSTVDLTPQHLKNEWFELPRINYALNGKKYKFAYGVATTRKESQTFPVANKITKIDVDAATSIDYASPGVLVSEPVFVADPTKSGEEDDGVILFTEFYEDPKDVSLVVLCAKTMQEVCKVDFKAEGAVTWTFHGIWNNLEGPRAKAL